MKLGPSPIKPWYFKDGAPINADVIRRIVGSVRAPRKTAPVLSRRLIMAVARYYARRLESYLVRVILAEIEAKRRRTPLTGDTVLDAKRLWRCIYQREYRNGARRRR